MSIKTFTAGERLTAQDLNDNFEASKVFEVYTGTDFNVSIINPASTTDTSATHEMTALSASDLSGADYLALTFSVKAYAEADDGQTGIVYFQIETKEVGGAYSDTLPETIILQSLDQSGAGSVYVTNLVSTTFYHTLTAGEKTNGVQVRLTGRCVANASGSDRASASITNVQVVSKGVY